jgi:glutamate dehydrogenase
VLRTLRKVSVPERQHLQHFYIADTLAMYPAIAQLLVRLFTTLFDPATPGDREAAGEDVRHQIIAALESVENLDRDRILRAFVLLIRRTLRTNFYQRDEAGQPKSYLSIKLSSQEIDLLPLPRPLFEIFVYSPRMEGCHLRGGRVARGGLRWSDRKEDFRTEILGLMKAQMVKNAVIVPTGSKGGFVVKRPGRARGADGRGGRLLQDADGRLLDLTDNIEGDTVARRSTWCAATRTTVPGGRRRQGHGDFLRHRQRRRHRARVLAGDAYASGGSVGYDHKAMGITSRAAGRRETPLPRTRDGYPDHRLHLRRRRRHVGRRVRQWHAAVPAYKADRRV